nr:hypothetical protein [Tanacetum cinerariifolium]
MADNQTMEKLLQAPTEGYEDAIVIPEITANNVELKHARIWLEKEPPRSIQTWDVLVSKFINQFFPHSKTTNLRNEIMIFQQRFDESFYEAWERFNDLLRACPHHGFFELHQLDTFYNALNINDQDSLNSATGTSSSTPAISSDIAELKDMVKALLWDKKNPSPAPTPSTTPASVKTVNQPPAYQAPVYQPPIPQSVSQTDFESYIKANDAIMRNMQSQGQSTQNQCQNIQNQYQNLQSQMATLTEMMSKFVNANTASSSGSGTLPVAPVSAPLPNVKPFIPYPSRRDNEKRRDQANEQIEKFYEIFKEMSFEISFTDALILMPKFTSTLKALIGNREKLDRSVSKPLGIAKDVSFKVGVFHFPADFVVVDFEPDPRVPLILGRNEAITYNLDQTVRYSTNYNQMTANKIDVVELAYEEYSQEDDPDSPKINPFYYDPEGDILLLEAILNSEPSPPLPNQDQNLPSFKEELKAYEAQTVKSSIEEPPEVELKDLPYHLKYAFLEGDNKLPVIIAKELRSEEKAALIKVLKSHKRAIAWKLSDIQGIHPEFCTYKILMEEDYKMAVQHQRRVNPKIHDVIKKEVEKLLDAGLIYPISDSPWVSPYAFLEGNNMLPVIIAKELGDEEKSALIKVLKSHKRVNPKIHDFIKKEVEKLLDAGLIYPISDSPWVSLVHCVPKKGGFTVVENEENKLIPTRLVTG